MCKINFKKTLPYIGSILFMIILSYIYFSPDILEGKVLFQGDTQQGIAIGQEGKAFREGRIINHPIGHGRFRRLEPNV